jgi:hypothetical protein
MGSGIVWIDEQNRPRQIQTFLCASLLVRLPRLFGEFQQIRFGRSADIEMPD